MSSSAPRTYLPIVARAASGSPTRFRRRATSRSCAIRSLIHASQPRGKADVVPHQLVAVASAPHFERQTGGTQHVHPVLVGRDNGDACLLVELGNVVDAVHVSAVTAHVVHDATA